MGALVVFCRKCHGCFYAKTPDAPCPFCGFIDPLHGVVKEKITLENVLRAHAECRRTASSAIDLSIEEVGTKFYTRNMTIATLVEKINPSLYRCMVQKDLVIFYNKRGKVITDDMRKTNINDLSRKV